MSERNLLILKGVSSAGKTSFSDLIAEPKVVCSADDHFYENLVGEYKFIAEEVPLAHTKCRKKFDFYIDNLSVKNIVIANTNVSPSHYQYYVDEAEKRGIRVTYVVLERRHNNLNTHNLPEHVLERQENTLRQNLKLR